MIRELRRYDGSTSDPDAGEYLWLREIELRDATSEIVLARCVTADVVFEKIDRNDASDRMYRARTPVYYDGTYQFFNMIGYVR